MLPLLASVAALFAPSAALVRYQIELVDRDEPLPLRLERSGKQLTFLLDGERLPAQVTRERGATFEFKLDASAGKGNLRGELTVRGREVSGVLHESDGDAPLIGRRVAQFVDTPFVPIVGEGFPNFDVAAVMTRERNAGLAIVKIENYAVKEIGTFGIKKRGESARIDRHTTFMTGTMGRPILHLAMVRLAAEGKVDLDGTLGAILGETRPEIARFTVRDLMIGNTGFPAEKVIGTRPSQPLPTLSEFLQKLPPIGKVELAMSSTYHEGLLQAVLEKQTGTTAATAIQRLVFDPLGMRDSYYGAPRASAAYGHYADGTLTLDGHHRYSVETESGLWTSAEDFGAFLSEYTQLLAGRTGKLFSEKDLPLLQKVRTEKSFLSIRHGKGYSFLGGAPYGFYCEFRIDGTGANAIAVLQNRNLGWRTFGALADGILGPRP